jgi:stage III sporulation protein AE
MSLLVLVVFLLFCPLSARAAGTEAEDTAENELGVAGEMMEDMELDQLQELLDGMLGEEQFSLSGALGRLIRGEEAISWDYVLQLVQGVFFSQWNRERSLVMQILLLLIAAAIFTNISRVFEQGQIGEISFYVVYLLLFMLLVEAFETLSVQLSENLTAVTAFMKGLAPAYFVAIAASTGTTTATVFYQVVLILSGMIQWVMLTFLLPGTNLYVLLQLVNHLSKEDILSKMAELLKTVIEWALKTMLGIVVGMQVVQGLIAPVMDSLKRSAIGKTASAIPGVGGAINAVTEIVLTSAILVRNCLGVVFLIAFLIWGITPIIKYAVNTFLYRLIAAVIQPISDRRMVGCITTMGDGCALLLRILLTTQVLCMLTVVILAVTFGGRG